VWSANHFYYNGELFSCLLYSSLEAIFLPPVKPGVVFDESTQGLLQIATAPQSVEKVFFDRLAEVEKGAKTKPTALVGVQVVR